MKNKHVAVLLKYYNGELNPFDAAALECALQTGANVTAVAMAPGGVLPALQSLTRLGVRAVLVSDPLYAGSDTVATSRVLAAATEKLQPDFVFCGRQSVNGDTAQVPPMLAYLLGLRLHTKVMKYRDGCFTLRSGEFVAPVGKQLFTFERMATLRFPSLFSKESCVTVWDNGVLNVPVEECGLRGSPTRVLRSYENKTGRRKCKFIDGADFTSVIQSDLHKPRVQTVRHGKEKIDAVYYAGDVRREAEAIAKKQFALSIQGKTPQEVASELRKCNAKAVLWQDSEAYKIFAAQTAVCLHAGLCADCTGLRAENGTFVMTRPALGGSIMADIVCISDIAMATVHTRKSMGSDLAFSVGRGATEVLPAIEEVAKRYGAELCCSRPVSDNGIMPYAAQIGLTGKTVAPAVYVAWGISGAVQHTCAIEGAGTVIAVNKDRNARIFDYADYGIVAEAENVAV